MSPDLNKQIRCVFHEGADSVVGPWLMEYRNVTGMSCSGLDEAWGTRRADVAAVHAKPLRSEYSTPSSLSIYNVNFWPHGKVYIDVDVATSKERDSCTASSYLLTAIWTILLSFHFSKTS